ncbi:MAG: amino acid adenylation domain-containing protein [Nitrospina sp.]|jgi:amino acid adenylation domain-containing protein|nr:amino acid adenylation domain-containing protein [Nitrospina sp.]MBT5631401.1 amino acid adenylation domain-containing protein [Nitrospina sp.]
MCDFELSEALKQRLDSFCNQYDCRSFHVFLASFQVLLYRYTSQKDLVTGTRTHPDSSGILVQCIASIENSLTFKQLLDEVSKPQEFPLNADSSSSEILLEALETKEPGLAPLYQVYLNVVDESTLSGDMIMSEDSDSSVPPFKLTIDIKEKDNKLIGQIASSIKLFDAGLFSRLATHFVNIVESGINNPDQSISELKLLSNKEHDKIVNGWNDNKSNFPGDGLIHHWIESVAKENPLAPAIELEGKTLSYSALDIRANQLANYLKTVGVYPDCCVGIYMSRSFESIIAILAILKAGGAYVPLDPVYPVERLQSIWQEMDSPLLILHSDLKNRIDVGGKKTLYLDTDWECVEGFSKEPPIVETKPENLSYVIFTSGSTGKPKGILLTHAGLNNLTHTSNRFFGVHKKSRVLQFSSFGFDVAVWEIFMALAAGGTLCLGTGKSLFSLLSLPKTLREEKITMALLPPSLLNVISPEGLDSLETVIAVGERCTNENVKKWAPGRKFFNGYGPAEGTVTVSAYLTNAEEPQRPLGPPIGRPLENIEIYILDSAFNPVPVGVPGEMCLGGGCIARGYMNQEQKTKEKFVKHPFRSGARIYRTGDRARYLPDGQMEFLGRVDHQVKIRGYRVEPGEIEAVLMGCSGVQACTVSVKKHANGQPYLVAYLVAVNPESLLLHNIKTILQQKLPSYMVPGVFMILKKMPLTPNGKVDRFALPEPKPSDFQEVSGDISGNWLKNFFSR